MNKKLPVVRVPERAEAARLADLPFEATVTLNDVAAAIKDGLLALWCTAGLLVMEQMMQEEVTAKVGPTGRHNLARRRDGRALPIVLDRLREDFVEGLAIEAAS